jgi:ribosomal protein L11 methyltransferase
VSGVRCQVSGESLLKTGTLWNISVTTAAEADEAVTELLQRMLSRPASSYMDIETGHATASVYLPREPDPIRLHQALIKGLAQIRKSGLEIAPARISIEKLWREDWAESWKRHFQPIQIGTALLVKPGWNRRRPVKGQALVVLNPGLSFGTGQHPTTGFCLRQLVLRRDRGVPQSFLDIGTGSGILAIAAAKLGYAPVEAIDSDPDSVRIAGTNARRNRVADKIRLRKADLTQWAHRQSRPFDLICANLTADLLLSERKSIRIRLKPGGVLVLAGILTPEFPTIQRAYRNSGLKLVLDRVEKEWRSGVFEARSDQKEFH